MKIKRTQPVLENQNQVNTISLRDIKPSSHISLGEIKIKCTQSVMEKSWQYRHIQSVMEIGQVPPSSAVIWLRMQLNGQVIVLCGLRMVVFHRAHLDLKPISYRKKGHSAALGAS